MASDALSSDDDVFQAEGRRVRGRGSPRRHLPNLPSRMSRSVHNRVDNLASTLQDTNRNLKAVDRMLEEYKDVGAQQTANMDRLRDDLVKTSENLRQERLRHSLRESTRSLRPSDLDDDAPRERRRRRAPTSPLRDYEKAASDVEHGGARRRQTARSGGGGVRFFDDMDAVNHLHGIHQSIRDLNSEQQRIQDDFNREMERRNRTEFDNKKMLRDLSESFKQPAIETVHAISNVDRKLQSIQDELRAERQMLRRKQEEVGHISSELRQALTQQKMTTTAASGTAPQDTDLKAKLTQAQSHREQVESELDKVRRKLDQSEGGRTALLDQMDELRRQLTKAEQDRVRLKAHIEQQEEDLREGRKRKTLEEADLQQWSQERRRLEEEVRDLREQLTKSASTIGDYGILRQELDKSERQRTQLSDHIEVLSKDTDNKEKYCAKLINQLQEMTDRYEDCEKQKHQTLLQLEESLKKLKDVTKEADMLAKDLKETREILHESELKRQDIKVRAQDTVRQWKLKCRKLERDLDREKHTALQTVERNQQLIKEFEGHKSQMGISGQQMENLRRELGDLLGVRAHQDEQLRVYDIEVNELKSQKMDLEKDNRDTKMILDRLEHELQSAHSKYAALYEEKCHLEDKMTSSQSAQQLAQDQVKQVDAEMKELQYMKVETAAKLAQAAQTSQELKDSLAEARHGESAARDEVAALMQRLKEEKEFNSTRLDTMKAELDEYKNRESKIVHDVSRRMKRGQAEYEAEIQALKLELSEERSASKILKRQQEKAKQEMDKLHKDLIQSQEETESMKQKYHKVRKEILTKTQVTEDGLCRAKEVELELLDAKEAMKRMEKDTQNILLDIGCDMDSVIEVASLDSIETYKALALGKGLPTDPQKWLAEMKSKLQWLKTEIRERRQKEMKLKTDVRAVVESGEKDRQFYVSEISRQHDLIDRLAEQRQELAEKDYTKSEEVSQLQDHVIELTGTLVAEKEDTLNKSMELEQERLARQLEAENFRDTQREREKILERYSKLQQTVTSLREELSHTNGIHTPKKSQSPAVTPVKMRRQVRISSPPIQDVPTKNGHNMDPKTPPPLSLSDEEFKERFMPRTPNLNNDSFY